MKLSVIKKSITDYWTHAIACKSTSMDKFDLIKSLATGKVLHVGCTDYPLDKVGSLHRKMIDSGIDVDGFDVDKIGISKLKELLPNHNFYDAVSQINTAYDLLVIPEVIEHVTSHENFFEGLNKIDFERFVLSVPNALYRQLPYQHDSQKDVFYEVVHPDHKCWYSPYTICFLIEETAKWKIEDVYLMHNQSQVVLVGKKSC